MAVFRVEKDRRFTVMSNYHLNDHNLSLKAKGLLSQMLSLPEAWNYTLKGLSSINRESVDAIRTAVQELERGGYIVRHQGREPSGKLAKVEYVIYEQPPNPPLLDFPITVNPTTVNPTTVNPTQLNTKGENTKKEKKQQSIYPAEPPAPEPSADRIDTMERYRLLIYENIEYTHLCERHGTEQVDELAGLMLDAVCGTKPIVRIAGEDKPREVVKSVLLKLNSSHIEYVFECLQENTTKIHNIKSYLLTALYNAPLTMDSYYQNAVNHTLYGGGKE